jgi:hypothetical protein
MSDRNVLELGYSGAYDRGEYHSTMLHFPEIRGSGATWLQLGGPARVLRVEDARMRLLNPSSRIPLDRGWGSIQEGSDGR